MRLEPDDDDEGIDLVVLVCVLAFVVFVSICALGDLRAGVRP